MGEDCSLKHAFTPGAFIKQAPFKLAFAFGTLRQIPELPEPTFAFLCYLFRGVAPHPNYPLVSVSR